jgi:hypothetical protein
MEMCERGARKTKMGKQKENSTVIYPGHPRPPLSYLQQELATYPPSKAQSQTPRRVEFWTHTGDPSAVAQHQESTSLPPLLERYHNQNGWMLQILSIKFENEEVGEVGEVAWVDKKKNFFYL